MILLLLLILPLSEEDNRLPKHVAKPEWTATIPDDTSKQGSNARPPPATDALRNQSLLGSSKHISGGLGVHQSCNYSVLQNHASEQEEILMDTYNPIEPAVTYESNRFITDEETSDVDLFKGFHITKNIIMLGMVTLFVASAAGKDSLSDK